MGNLERPVNLTVMSLDYGRKPEYPERTYACTGRTCKLYAERPSTLLVDLPTAPQCSPKKNKHVLTTNDHTQRHTTKMRLPVVHKLHYFNVFFYFFLFRNSQI
ncbi:hypothetical protein ATANTOWER_029157 [Ataeniobius toweri]|uniref:Uncharacterized protein n=1 Tax=Ataeniobius toweri TaxID=208326 RepID=A0ABU7C101_9TELE|nr:hypothetical protein [Ataeniobius toweri]